MMKSKPSLKNLAKSALLFSFLVCLLLSGCSSEIKPTYQEEDIPYLVKKICKDEYNLDVTTKRTNTTLWIYAPVSKIFHKDYGVKPDKFLDDEMMEKARNILTTIGRVLISSDNTPQFFALVFSDINLGIDYYLIGSVLDIKKSYSGFVPWTEANRRYLIRGGMAPEAIGDLTGKHLKFYDLSLPDFLAEQIAQRIAAQFQDETLKKYFEVEKSTGRFDTKSDTFLFEYGIKQLAKPEKEIDLKKMIVDIITYCIQTYEFRDFAAVTVVNLSTRDKVEYNQAAIWGRPKD